MRILLAQNSLYYPAHGGGDKSNRLADGSAGGARARLPGGAHRGWAVTRAPDGVRGGPYSMAWWSSARGVEVHTVTDANLRAHFAGQVEAFAPEIILASTDDPAQMLLEAALRAPNARVVYLARATLALPFGPDCAFPGELKTGRIRAADGVVGVSQYVADYIRQHAGIDAVHVPISLMERGDWPASGAVRQPVRHPGEPVRGEGNRHFPGAGGRLSRDGVCGRAHVGHQPAGPARRCGRGPTSR